MQLARRLSILAACCTLAGFALAQSTAPASLPQFEVVSIKPAPSEEARMTASVHIDGAQVHYENFNLKDLVRYAYATNGALINGSQIEGPEGFDTQRFDVDATLPAGATQAQVPDMLKEMLLTRFQMQSRRVKKDYQVYALLVSDKSKLTPSAASPDAPADVSKAPVNVSASGSANGVSVDLGNGAFYQLLPGNFEAKRLTMDRFANLLTRFSDRPVVNATELPGLYDFKFSLTEEGYNLLLMRSAIAAGVQLPPQALAALPALAGDSSLEQGLATFGLRLNSRKSLLDAIVIDHILTSPTAN